MTLGIVRLNLTTRECDGTIVQLVLKTFLKFILKLFVSILIIYCHVTAIGLEAVLGSPAEEITKRLADRLSYLTAKTRDERKEIQDEFVTFYKHRSQIIHAKAASLSDEQAKSLRWGQRMLRRALGAELALIAKTNPPDDPLDHVPGIEWIQ